MQRRRVLGANGLIQRRLRHGAIGDAAIDAERHVHRPIIAAFAIFAGTVQRIDQPDTGVLQAGQIGRFFFRQDRIIGAQPAQFGDKEGVADAVPFGTQGLAFGRAAAQFEQHLPGSMGEVAGEFSVSHARSLPAGAAVCNLVNAGGWP